MTPTVDIAQTTWEFETLLDLLDGRVTGAILEVGIWEGGTLWHWLEMASEVVAIDDTMRDPGPDVWQAWADRIGTDLELLHGSSQDPAIIEAARRSGPYDLVFIDGDHSYEGVTQDFRNYVGMVAPGGLIAFHDIVPRDGYGVSQLWGEVKASPGRRTLEIVENSGRHNGIGCVFV